MPSLLAKCILVVLMTISGMVSLPAADTPPSDVPIRKSRIEPFLRAVQERYKLVHHRDNRSITMPKSVKGQEAPEGMPPDEFYNGVKESEYQSIIRDALTNCAAIIPYFRETASLTEKPLELTLTKGAPLAQSYAAAVTALGKARYLHVGPGGASFPVQGTVRRIMFCRKTTDLKGINQFNTDVDIYSSAMMTGGNIGIYDMRFPLQSDEGVFSMSMRALGWTYFSLNASSDLTSGFEYGFELVYDLGKWRGASIQPFYTITWYNGVSQGTDQDPVWPTENVGFPNTPPPFWAAPSAKFETVDPPTPWFNSVSQWGGAMRNQRWPVRKSGVFPDPTMIPCSSSTAIKMNVHHVTTSRSLNGKEHDFRANISARLGIFYQYDYQGFLLDTKQVFTTALPHLGPMEVAGVYPGSCPSCVGVITTTGSIIDNGSMTYYHDAWDYRAAGASGCGPCGGGAAASAGGIELSLGRIHRYRDLDWGASFGPGVLSNHDLRLQIFASNEGGLAARFFDPLQRLPCELSGAPGESTLRDPAAVARRLMLRDDEGLSTANLTQARTAELELFDGRTCIFQVFPMQAGDSMASAGRIIQIRDGQGRRLDYAYIEADPQAIVAVDDADVAGLWRFSSITDDRGMSARFTWAQAAGQWVISQATMPGGGVFAYRYGEQGLIALSGVAYPTGESSRFVPGWEAAEQWVSLDIADAGADSTHRRKRVFLTPSIETGVAGGASPQLPNLIRKLVNGSGEVGYCNWVEGSGGNLDIYYLTGGGVDGAGVLRWLRYQGGRPTVTKVAERYFPDQPFSSHTWETESEVATDANWRPALMRDPDGSYTTYERDDRGNITARIRHRPDDSVVSRTTTTYDARNNPLEITDELGRVTRNAYDARGLLTQRTVAVGTVEEASWTYSYDEQGRLLSTTDANGHSTLTTYDAATGLVASIIEPGDDPGIPMAQRPTRRFTYDAAGRPLTSSDQSGRTVTYAYDGRGRQTSATYADGTTELTVYGVGDDANLVAKQKNRNGIWTEFVYDGHGRQVEMVVNRGQSDQVLQSWAYVPSSNQVARETVNGRTTTYTYDGQQRISAVTTWAAGGSAETTRSFTDEAAGLAISTDTAGRRTFFLETPDRLRSRTVREAVVGALVLDGTSAEQAAALWALARPTGGLPSYVIDETIFDVAGQVVSRTDATGVATSTLYDAQGRTTRESTTDPVTGQTVTTAFTYDANGNRTEVVLPRSFAPDAPGRFVASTTYTGRNLPATQTQAFTPTGSTQPTQVVTTATTYTPTGKTATQSDPRNAAWLTSFQYGECCDRLKAITDAMGFTSGSTTDAEGRVTASTDANGHVSQTTYDAQGRVATRLDAQGRMTRITYDEDMTDGVGLDARFASIVADLGFGPQARGSAVLTVAASSDFTLVIQDGLGREVCRVEGKMP